MTPFGHFSDETVCLLYYDGTLESLIYRDGNSRLTSASAADGLSYSNSFELWASGMPVETMNRLTVEDGALSIMPLETGTRQNLFSTKAVGRAHVQAGQREAFNSGTGTLPFGQLEFENFGLTSTPRLVVVDDCGEQDSSQLDDSLDRLETLHRGIVMLENVRNELAARFQIETPELFGKVQSTLFPAAYRPINAADLTVEFSTKVDQPLGEAKPTDPWVVLENDKEIHLSAISNYKPDIPNDSPVLFPVIEGR